MLKLHKSQCNVLARLNTFHKLEMKTLWDSKFCLAQVTISHIHCPNHMLQNFKQPMKWWQLRMKHHQHQATIISHFKSWNKGAKAAQHWSDLVILFIGCHISLVHMHTFQYCVGWLACQFFSYSKKNLKSSWASPGPRFPRKSKSSFTGVVLWNKKQLLCHNSCHKKIIGKYIISRNTTISKRTHPKKEYPPK